MANQLTIYKAKLRRWTPSGLLIDDFELGSSRSQILCLYFMSIPLTEKNVTRDVALTKKRLDYLVPENVTPKYPL